MKKLILVIFPIVLLFSCSSNKQATSHTPELDGAGAQVVSYGPKGRINTPVTSKSKSVPSLIKNGDQLIIEKPSPKTTSAEITHLEKEENKVAETIVKPRQVVPTESIKRKSKPQWEPYRDKNATPEKSKNGFAIAGFVMSFFWFLAPLAFVFSIIGMQSEKRGLAIAGIVLSGLTLLVFLIALILYLTGYI